MKYRRWTVFCALMVSVAMFGGADRPYVGVGNGVGDGARVGVGRNGVGTAIFGVDTLKIRSRTVSFPNSAAISAGYSFSDSSLYDFDNKADDGSTVMWGFVNKLTPDSVYYYAANSGYGVTTIGRGGYKEINFSWNSAQTLAFIWVSSNGLKPGKRIESAYLMLNADVQTAFGVDFSDLGLSCRLDTVSADYAMLTSNVVSAGYGTANEPARFDISWNSVVASTATAWSPTLDSRDDWNDFGPRSGTSVAAGTYVGGTCFRFDVTDAVQQVVDRAINDPTLLSRGFIFVPYFYGSGASNPSITHTSYFAAGNFPLRVGAANDKGNPVFVATQTSTRGRAPWGGGVGMPMNIVFDSGINTQVWLAPTILASGHKMAFGNSTSEIVDQDTGALIASPAPDSLLAARGDSLYSSLVASGLGLFTHQQVTGIGIGEFSYAKLDTEMRRQDYLVWSTPPDTTEMHMASWPAGGGTQTYSMEALSALVKNGWTSSRGTFHNLYPVSGHDYTPFGDFAVHPIMWSRPQNMLALASQSASALYGDGPDTLAENLADAIDQYYGWGVNGQASGDNAFGHPGLVIYVHTYSLEGIDPGRLQDLLDAIDASPGAHYMDYDVMISRRMNGSYYLDPETITEANGYLAIDANAAAVEDSFRFDNPGDLGDRMLSVWRAPVGEIVLSTPDALVASSLVDTVRLTWDAINPASSYSIYRGDDSTSVAIFKTGVATNAYDDIAAGTDSTKYYKVAAISSTGTSSFLSDFASGEFISSSNPDSVPPATPTLLTLTNGEYQHTLTWTSNSEGDFDHYNIYRGEAVGSIPATTLFKTNYTDTTFTFNFTPDFYGAVLDTTFNWQVTAVDTLGNESSKSNRRTAKPQDTVAPGTPVMRVASINNSAIRFEWTAIDDTSRITYNVYIDESNPPTTLVAENTPAVALDYGSAVNGLRYYGRVRAIDVAGNVGNYSDVTSGVGSSYQYPVLSSVTVDSLYANATESSFDVSATGNKTANYKIVWWFNHQTEPDTAGFDWSGAYTTALDTTVATAYPWATSDSDSSVSVHWGPGSPAPTTGYIARVRYDQGSGFSRWIELADTTAIAAADTSFTHDQQDSLKSIRGILDYVVTAYSDTIQSVAAALDSTLYNDAMMVNVKVYFSDGTNTIVAGPKTKFVIDRSGM